MPVKDTSPAAQLQPPPPPTSLNDGANATQRVYVVQQPDRRAQSFAPNKIPFASKATSGSTKRVSPTTAVVLSFNIEQRVSVNVPGRGWLVGTVTGILTKVTGIAVKVRYMYRGRPEEGVFENDPDHIIPYNEL